MKTQKNKFGISNGMSLILGIILSGSLFLQSCSKEEVANLNPVAGNTAAADNDRKAGDMIFISHEGSFDGTPLPVYTVTISQPSDLSRWVTVTYTGIDQVLVRGTVKWNIKVAQFNSFLDRFRDMGLYELPEEMFGGNEYLSNKIVDKQTDLLPKSIHVNAQPEIELDHRLIDFQRSVESELLICRYVNGCN